MGTYHITNSIGCVQFKGYPLGDPSNVSILREYMKTHKPSYTLEPGTCLKGGYPYQYDAYVKHTDNCTVTVWSKDDF